MQVKRLFRLRAAAVVLAVASLLFCLATLGIDLPPTLIDSIVPSGPVAADSDGTHSAIVDAESRRVLILNEDLRLMGMVNCEALNAPLEAVTDVCVANDTLYVAGVRYQKDTNVIVQERIVAYNMRGMAEQVVFSLDVGYGETPRIKGLDSVEDGVYAITVAGGFNEDETESVKVMYASRDGSHVVDGGSTDARSVYDIGYSARLNAFATISERGVFDDTSDAEEGQRLSTSSYAFVSLDIADDGNVYLYDDITQSIYALSNDGGELKLITKGAGYSELHVNGHTLAACNRDGNHVLIANLDEMSFTSVSTIGLSRSMAFFVGAVIACRVYLVLFAAGLAIRRARMLVAQQRTGQIGALVGSAAVVFVVFLAIGYTTYGSYRALQETRAKEINAFADYLSIVTDDLGELVEQYGDRSAFRKNLTSSVELGKALGVLASRVGGLAYAATYNGIGMYVKVYGIDDQGIFYLYDSSHSHVLGTGEASSVNGDEIASVFETGRSDGEIHAGRTRYDATQHRLVPISSSAGGKAAGVIEIGSSLRTFEASIAQDQTRRILALLVLVVVVYLTYTELKACARCFVAYGQLQHSHDAVAVLTRPFSFFITLLSSTDAVMTTLIARDLLNKMGTNDTGFLLALPSVMLGVGLALGQAVYALLGSRVVINKLMRRGAVAMAVAAVYTAVVVGFENYWLYCLAKLAMAVPFGLLYTLSYSLPRRADTEEVRLLAAGGIRRTDTSAAALGTVAGGYAAQNLGNAWVYVVVAGVSLVVYAMARAILPKSKHPLEEESAAARRQLLARLAGSGTVVPIVLFIMLPGILSAGYNSFLFPLFSANVGLPTSSINNLFVLGQIVVFVAISGLEALDERLGKWRVACCAIALLGVVFLLFSINTSLAWAVTTIAWVGVLCKASDAWKALWVRAGEAVDVPAGIVTGAMFSVRSVLLIVQPLLLSTLLGAGEQQAVIVLGVVCSLSALAFHRTTRNSALAQ